MANKHLKLKAHTIDERTWWYEEPGGIEIIAEVRDKDGWRIASNRRVKISWRAIRAALERKDMI